MPHFASSSTKDSETQLFLSSSLKPLQDSETQIIINCGDGHTRRTRRKHTKKYANSGDNGGRAEFIFKLVQICQENRATYVLRSRQPRIFLCTFYLGFVSGMMTPTLLFYRRQKGLQ